MPKFEMNNVGGGNAVPNELRWVYLNDIVPNERNEKIYGTEGIESLADDILLHGLLQAPLVHPIENGKYKVISGHRRLLALRRLADSGNAEFNKVQVIIDNDADEISLGLKLISANAENRILSNAELLSQTQEYMTLLTEWKQKENMPGKVRDMVAKKLNVSTGTVSELLAIGNNLEEPLLTHFKEGWISKSVAVEMSKLDSEHQQWVADVIWNTHRQFSVKEIREMRTKAVQAAEFAEIAKAVEVPEEVISNAEALGVLDTSSSAPENEEVIEDVNEDVNEDVEEQQEEFSVEWDSNMGWVPMDSRWEKLTQEAVLSGGIDEAPPCVVCHNATRCQGCCRKCNLQDDCGMSQYNYGECAKIKAEAKAKAERENQVKTYEGRYELEVAQVQIRQSIIGMVLACKEFQEQWGCEKCPVCQNGNCLIGPKPFENNWMNNIYL